MSELIGKIRARGYWDAVIRPQPYKEGRVPYAQLDEIIAAAAVRMRGWPVPFFNHREQPLRGDHWIGQDIDARGTGHYEAWRFYTSGQFNHLRAVGIDWRHMAEIAPAAPPADEVIEVWEILFYPDRGLRAGCSTGVEPGR